MKLKDSHLIIKALAEPSRVLLLNTLLQSPQCVEELAKRLKLAESTVSFHLKKLEAAKLVSKQKEQYYVVYSPNLEFLEMTLGELIRVDDIEVNKQEDRLKKYRQSVLRSFFKQGRLLHLPVQRKKRRIVLEEILSKFSPGKRYVEKEINEIIARYYDDYCTVRREFICEKMMVRKEQTYWIEVTKDKTMDKKTELKKEYKLNPPLAGIFKITNIEEGKIFIGKAQDVRGKLNGQQAQLQWGGHRNKELQKDWLRLGADKFTFEVLDTLKTSDLTTEEIAVELETLELLWIDKLKPFGEKGYNQLPKHMKLIK